MSEAKLLPLPEPDYLMPQGQGRPDIPAWSENTVRQLVAHATAAKDAEIEALRAEVAWQKRVTSAHAELHGEAKERAERLAEAIRAYKAECDNPAKDYVLRAKRRDEMFALLRDHDQETKK